MPSLSEIVVLRLPLNGLSQYTKEGCDSAGIYISWYSGFSSNQPIMDHLNTNIKSKFFRFLFFPSNHRSKKHIIHIFACDVHLTYGTSFPITSTLLYV